MMWSQLPVRNLIHMQRIAAVVQAGREIKALHEQGYGADADRLLEELHARIESWKQEEAA